MEKIKLIDLLLAAPDKYKEQMGNASLETLQELLKDCEDTILFLKNNKPLAIHSNEIVKNWESNTMFALSVCEELIIFTKELIDKKQ